MDISMWFPAIEDVANVYQSFRRNGQSREEAVNSTLKAFDIEQLDRDDEALIYIGLAKCTGMKKELTEAILNKSIQAFESLKNEYPSLYKELDSAEERINNKQLIGPEAHYKQKKRFVPHWEIGDTFICRLTGDYPKQYAMEDWYAIIRKAKTDFARFTEMLEATRRRLDQAGESIDSAVSRTRTIRKKLSNIETDVPELPESPVEAEPFRLPES